MADADRYRKIWYRLDRDDWIVAMGVVEGAGDAEDEVPAPDFRRVVGSNLMDHVRGHFTRRFLKQFLEQARKAGAETRQSYRCDSPNTKILMEMRANVEAAGTLLVTHERVEQRPLPFPIVFRTAPARATIMRCSPCNRVTPRSGGSWQEPEALLSPGVEALVIHTVCLDCRAGLSARARWPLAQPVAGAPAAD